MEPFADELRARVRDLKAQLVERDAEVLACQAEVASVLVEKESVQSVRYPPQVHTMMSPTHKSRRCSLSHADSTSAWIFPLNLSAWSRGIAFGSTTDMVTLLWRHSYVLTACRSLRRPRYPCNANSMSAGALQHLGSRKRRRSQL